MRFLVKPFVQETKSFLLLLQEHGAVLSGSVALKFFVMDEEWDIGDLDIYVGDLEFGRLRTRLVEDSSTGFVETYDSEVAPWRKRYDVKQLVRFSTKSGRVVDLVRSSTPSPLTPLTDFWSTLVVNCISLDYVACFYPRYTMRREAVLKPGALSYSDLRAVSKYIDRGYDLNVSRHWVAWPPPPGGDVQIAGQDAVVRSVYPFTLESPGLSHYLFRTGDGWYIPSSLDASEDGGSTAVSTPAVGTEYDGTLIVALSDDDS